MIFWYGLSSFSSVADLLLLLGLALLSAEGVVWRTPSLGSGAFLSFMVVRAVFKLLVGTGGADFLLILGLALGLFEAVPLWWGSLTFILGLGQLSATSVGSNTFLSLVVAPAVCASPVGTGGADFLLILGLAGGPFEAVPLWWGFPPFILALGLSSATSIGSSTLPSLAPVPAVCRPPVGTGGADFLLTLGLALGLFEAVTPGWDILPLILWLPLGLGVPSAASVPLPLPFWVFLTGIFGGVITLWTSFFEALPGVILL